MARVTSLILVLLLLATPPVVGKAKEPPPPEELVRLTPKIAQFLADEIRPGQPRQFRLNALLTLIFAKDGLGIRYGNVETRTPAETFEARSGNCLSFTMLFVAMARHMGLRAYFKEVDEVTSRDLKGEMLVANRHMFAEVEIDNGVAAVDFLPGTEKAYKRVRRISDLRAAAHFYNNLGGERLLDGDAAGAAKLFQRALAADDTLVPAWTNLGVAERRLKRFAEAEASYRRALAIDASEPTALANLAGLYLALGRVKDAEPLLTRVNAYLADNPFHHFRVGTEALRSGDPDGALRHLREAARRQPDEVQFQVGLADVFLALGDAAQAREALEKALRSTREPEQRAAINRRISGLGARSPS